MGVKNRRLSLEMCSRGPKTAPARWVAYAQNAAMVVRLGPRTHLEVMRGLDVSGDHVGSGSPTDAPTNELQQCSPDDRVEVADGEQHEERDEQDDQRAA